MTDPRNGSYYRYRVNFKRSYQEFVVRVTDSKHRSGRGKLYHTPKATVIEQTQHDDNPDLLTIGQTCLLQLGVDYKLTGPIFYKNND